MACPSISSSWRVPPTIAVFSTVAHNLLKQIVRSALSHIEEAADEGDVLEAWISLRVGNAQLFSSVQVGAHTSPGGSPDKTGNIKTSKLSGVFAEFELAVDLSKSVSTLHSAPIPRPC